MTQNTGFNPLITYAASVAAGVAAGFLIAKLSHRYSSHAEPQPSKLPSANSAIVKAIHFSAQCHRDQRRKDSSKSPYICHPVSVARRLAVDADIRDPHVLIAALLHDTVEDTNTTLDDIDQRFGLHVAKIVDEVSDDKSLPKQTRKQLQIDHAPHISRNAKLVKLADKLDNLTDMLNDTPEAWTADRVEEYFSWAEKVIEGLRGTNDVLESQLDDVLAQRGKAIRKAQSLGT